jgi:hypothetical protein
MTDEFNPYEMPSPEERRRMLGGVPGDTGVALRLANAFAEEDGAAARAVIDEIAASARAMYVMSTLALITCRLAHALVSQVGGDASTWLHGAAAAVMDEVDRSLEGEAEQ